MMRKHACGLVALVLLAFGLSACPPPGPVLAVEGATLSILPDGRSRLSVLVSNGGTDDFDGEVCLRTTWVAEGVFETDKVRGTAPIAGTVLQEKSECVRRVVVHDGDALVDVESTAAMPEGAFVLAKLENEQVVELAQLRSALVSASE